MDLLLYGLIGFPMIAAIAGYLTGKKNKAVRDLFAEVVTGLEFCIFFFLLVRILTDGSFADKILEVRAELPGICGMGLHFKPDGFRVLYGMIASFMWFMSTLFSREYLAHSHNRNRYYLFLLFTLGATEGVFLSADFYTTFLFFEIMSLSSYVWVAHDEKKDSLRAAGTYLGISIIGGLVMLMGIFVLYHLTGTLYFEELTNACWLIPVSSSEGAKNYILWLWIAGSCLLFGFGAKAGAFPLHVWLPKAHPVAPAPASALLSGILTKAGIFGILVLGVYLFPGFSSFGMLILLLGTATMFLGAVLAVFSIDLKRTLACSSVSQIGFILVGIGMAELLRSVGTYGNPLAYAFIGASADALQGSFLHMINHSLIKLVLFMAAGVVFMNVHKLDLNEIRGFGRKKPLLNYIFLMGALGIGGIPLWNGYVSKTLIHEGIAAYMELIENGFLGNSNTLMAFRAVEWFFLVSGGLTIAYMTKLYVAIFVEKNQDAKIQKQYDSLQGKYMNKISAAVLTISATLLPIMGFLPGPVMLRLADFGRSFLRIEKEAEAITWFSLHNLQGVGVSVGIGIVVYVLFVRICLMEEREGAKVYRNYWHRYLDLENIVYRPLLLKILPFLFGVFCRILDSLVDTTVVVLRKTIYRDSKLPHELEEGTVFTYTCGSFMNMLERLANRTIWRKKQRNVDYEHKLAMFHEEWSEDATIIIRGLSFGLLLFCVGLIMTVAYVLLVGIG